ncbi:MAG: DUF5131 family protein [Proteobacteria bacterium]|nr:DUF5131 family protein [Pseudomonadota bacterium]
MSGPYWTKAWNPVRGCTPVSPGCARCWAQAMHERFRSEPFNVVTCLPEVLSKPIHWRKPQIVFIDCADLFHEKVPFEFIRDVYATMEEAHWHTFLICTKRPQRRLDFFKWLGGGSLQKHERENVWEGVTAEDQQRADERIPMLLATPAAHRWISVEPMLEPIDFIATGKAMQHSGRMPADRTIDQVIVGAESGHGMRPCNVEWVRDMVQHCAITRSIKDNKPVPCFVKQLHIDGKLVTDPAQFPEDLRVRELEAENHELRKQLTRYTNPDPHDVWR